MNCKTCDQDAIGTCRKCGMFWCAQHGGHGLGAPLCTACYDSWRPWGFFAALVFVALGGFGLYLAIQAAPAERRAGGFLLLFVIASVVMFALAALFIWWAVRSFPLRR